MATQNTGVIVLQTILTTLAGLAATGNGAALGKDLNIVTNLLSMVSQLYAIGQMDQSQLEQAYAAGIPLLQQIHQTLQEGA